MRTESGLGAAGLIVIALSSGCQVLIGYEDAVLDDAGVGGNLCDIDGMKNGSETGTDCGGSCAPCPDGEGCAVGTDCQSHMCVGGNCVAAGCADQAQAACYSGPDGTRGVGACQDGIKICDAAGRFGPCEGDLKPKVERCSNAADENCDSFDCVEQARLLGDSDIQEPHAVAVDSEGNSYVVGSFQGAIELDSDTLVEVGGGDAFVVKLDADAKTIWAKQFGSQSAEAATATAIDSAGNIIVAGWSDGPIDFGGAPVPSGIFVAKLSAAGVHLWSKSFGGAAGSAVNDLAVMPGDDDVLCGGHFLGTINFGDGGMDANAGLLGLGTDGFIAKIRGTDGSGKASDGSWAKVFGDDEAQSLRNVRAGPAGTVVVSGNFVGSMNLTGVALTSSGQHDIFMAKLSSTGSSIWQKRFGDGQDQTATGLAIDSNGAALVAGWFAGTIQFDVPSHTAPPGTKKMFLAKYATGGTPEWSKELGNAEGTVTAAFDAEGNALLTGGFTGAVDLGGGVLEADGTDVFIAKLSSSGSIVWSKRFGDSSNQFARAIGVAPSGESVIVGVADGAINFGTGPLSAAGGWDIFVARFGL